jgi:hypothetical protein
MTTPAATKAPVAAQAATAAVDRPVFRGNAALKRLGVRLAWIYLGAGGLAMVVQGGPDPVELIGLLVVLAGTGFLVVAACNSPRTDVLCAAVAANTLATAMVIKVAADQGWPSSSLLANTVATGATIGIALGRRPFAGLFAAALAVAAMSVTSELIGAPIPVIDLFAIPTSTSVAASIAVLVGRGFVETEAALRGVDDALAMQRVAYARWQAGRRSDRELHDTLLTTLTLLAHRDFPVDPEPVRELCRRDLAFLARDSWRAERVAGLIGIAEPAAGDVVLPWSSGGLQVRRLGQVDQLAALGPVTGPALDAAVEQCLQNVARHAGVEVAQVVVSREADDLVVLVVDEGCGFDPEQVPADRLGLADSVRGRIAELGGSVAVWSRPGAGTTVMLSVPIGAEAGVKA